MTHTPGGAGQARPSESVHDVVDLVDLARTRSYVITAEEERREKVLANLDWYVHEHLGHGRGSTVGLPYRTDLFLYRVA